LALLYFTLFLVAFVAANVVAYTMVENYLYQRLDANVAERFREISSSFDRSGIAGARSMIESHGPAISNGETLYSLFDSEGRLVSGNIDLSQVGPGFTTEIPSQHEASRRNYRFLSGTLGTYRLVIGISYDDTNTLRNVMASSLGLATAFALATGLGSAALLAIRMQRRIQSVSTAMHAVAEGELSTRLAVSPRRDEIDALAAEINTTLEKLQESVATIKRVTTDIAHDLKTPIGRLLLQLERASEEQDVPVARELILSALDEVKLITATFDALLRISQIEARARRTRVAPVDLRGLALDVAATYSPVFQDSGRTLVVYDNLQQPVPAPADRDLFRQMLANVFNNAIRHTPPGAEVTFSLSEASGMLLLDCADNGPGVPAAERDKVFRRFYRVDASRSTEGTGLGLSLVKAIVDFHGGSIVLRDNNPGLGVQISLPLAP